MFKACSCVLALLLGIGLISAQDKSAGSTEKVDPRVKELMKRMGTFLESLKKYALEAEETIDEWSDEAGMYIQLSHQRKVLVVRPNGVHSTTSGDQQRCFYYNGKTITLHERDKNTYVTVPAPDTIEKAMQDMHEKYGMNLPLADLLLSRPDAAMLKNVDYAFYLGERTIENVKCHHIACSQRNIDWQLWVEQGEQPLPRKLVITHTRLGGDPKYVAVIKKWNLDPKPEPGCFDFKKPEGAMQMDMPRLGVDPGRDK